MENNKPSFSKFGKDFQESLCQMIMQDRPFADQIMEVLDIGFLELHYLRVFVQKIFEYREEYGVHPTYKIMISIIRADIEEEKKAVSQGGYRGAPRRRGGQGGGEEKAGVGGAGQRK